MRRLFFLLTLMAACAIVAAPAGAQREPERPNLPRGSDTNDWEAYFELGERHFWYRPAEAAAAFYWASRLDPTRAEPLFARWAAFFAREQGTWEQYVQGNRQIRERPEVLANDELVLAALHRNPFVHRGLEAALLSSFGRRLRTDNATRAFMNYGEGDFRQAAELFGQVVRENPAENVRYRQWRALALVGEGQLDSAVVELDRLLAALRARDQASVAYYYESKAMQEYALGMLHEARGRPAQARSAWERALEEDLAMYPARAALARLSLRTGKAAEAVEHMAQAAELAPDDAVMHFEHGNALMGVQRWEDAVAAYQRALQLEPHWADPYIRLGVAHENAGRPAEAAAAYRGFLQRAPRRLAPSIQRATERLAALGQPR
jgi:tetratricopeptide (TPR) repeat protein